MKEVTKIDQSFRPIVGIDLGTTNSSASYIRNGQAEMIHDQNGNAIIPSVVLIDPNEKIIVGEDARSALIAMPDRTKAAVKREMGSGKSIPLSGKTYTPEEVSGFVLKHIKDAVDTKLGAGEKEAVITVPAYFTDEQRQATKRAGELAGFVVERIINEPTAAALAFGYSHLDADRQLLVYDLGGGTFDVSVVEMMDGILEVKASTGNSNLGGEDFDRLIVDWLAEKMIREQNVDPREDIRGKALLKEEAEKAKVALSTEDEVEIALPVVMMKDDEPLGLYQTLTQETFISLIDSLLSETIDKVKEVLTEAVLKPEEIDDVLLVGGSTRIPHVHQLITNYFAKAPQHDINPDEAVSLGAAVQAGLKSGALSDSGLIITDVAPFSMGIAVLDGSSFRADAYKAIIPRNTTIPVTRSETFYTSMDNQTAVQIEIYQGEHDKVKRNHFLNDFLLEGLPENPAGSEAVEVTFRYNLNGILEVTAKSVSTGKLMTVSLQDAIDRNSEDAFQQSLEKVEAAASQPDEEEDDLFEQQDIFDLLDDADDESSTVGELVKEAKQWKERCQGAHKDVPEDKQEELGEIVSSLNKAIETEEYDDLDEAIDMATDIFIDLEI